LQLNELAEGSGACPTASSAAFVSGDELGEIWKSLLLHQGNNVGLELLAWPSVAFLLGVICIFTFKHPLSRFLDRAQQITAPGVQAVARAQGIALQQANSQVDELLKNLDTPLVRIAEDTIVRELEQRKIVEHAEREKVLIKYLAVCQNALRHENAYRLIWGSQLFALEMLNASFVGIPPEHLQPIYADAVAKNEDVYRAYSFDQWTGFLKQANLVREDSGAYHITIEGRDFLRFLVEQGRSRVKPL
jgi:hypothetical protein